MACVTTFNVPSWSESIKRLYKAAVPQEFTLHYRSNSPTTKGATHSFFKQTEEREKPKSINKALHPLSHTHTSAMDATPPMLPMNYPFSGIAMQNWKQQFLSQANLSIANSHVKHHNNTATMPSGDDELSDSRLLVIAMALLFFVVIITVLFTVQWAVGYCDDDETEDDETLRLLEDARTRFRSLTYNDEDSGSTGCKFSTPFSCSSFSVLFPFPLSPSFLFPQYYRI